MLIYLMIFVSVVFAAIFGLYFFHIFVVPRKIEEIASMIENGQTSQAIKRLNELLEKDDRDSYAHFLLAKAYKMENNMQYAILEFRQVLKLGRFNDKIKEVEVRSILANIYKERNAIEEAKKEFLILTQIDSLNYRHYYEIGMIFFNSGTFEKALSYFKKSIALNNKHDMSHYYYGQTLYRLEMYAEAKQALLEAIKIDHANYKAHYFLGLVLRQLSDYEWALKEFDVASKSDEIKVKCYLAKGTCYIEKDQYPKAVLEFDKGLRYARKGSDAECNLRYFMAEAQEKMRDLHSAIQNWELIYKYKKNFRDVHEKLAKYGELRQDDNVKDFLIAGLAQFEIICRKMVEALGYNIIEIETSDTEVEIIATEPEGRFRNMKRSNRLIMIIRSTGLITDTLLRKLNENLKSKNATRIVIITAGEFSQSAIEFANTRPIDLLGKSKLVEILSKIS
ncbi:MAG: tetratricopeptide repeat protein [Spirochaetes bacterium]|nr:tetratricopeptide repeat protein [Spirochaetota bacterium]